MIDSSGAAAQGSAEDSTRATPHLSVYQLCKDPKKERHLAFQVPDRWMGGVVLGMSNGVNEAFGDGMDLKHYIVSMVY